MQRLLSSTTTKGGRTVEPSTVAPLARLATAAAVELAGLAERRCGGVRVGFRKGSGGAMRCGGERWEPQVRSSRHTGCPTLSECVP